MARVSQYDAASALDGTESFPVVQSSTTKKATVADLFPARTTWAAAGGSAPGIACVDPFSIFTEANPTFGTGATKDSSWTKLGKEVRGHFRIIFGTGATAGEGIYVITGMPALPLLTGGNARFIGSGVAVDISASGRTTPVQLLVDPGVDPTRPIISCPGVWTDVEGTQTYTASAIPLVCHNVPFTFADGDIINITFAFETA